MRQLTKKQEAFIEYYLQNWNAAEAARLAGYSVNSARSIGNENLTKPDIIAAIRARLSELSMDTDEIIVRLTEHARGDITQFLKTNMGSAYIDMDELRRAGKAHLIKKLTYNEEGQLRGIEFYDAQSALVQLGRIRGLFTERTQQDVNIRVETVARYLEELPQDDYDSVIAEARAVIAEHGAGAGSS